MTMHGPPLVAWLLVALSAAAAAACVLRGRSRQEALTAAGMAAMAVPLSVADPWRWAAPAFAAVFACTVLHTLATPSAHAGHRTHHLVCSASMVYMALAMSWPTSGHAGHPGHAMHGGAGVPLLTAALLLYFAAYVVRMGARLVTTDLSVPGAAATAPRPEPSPGLAVLSMPRTVAASLLSPAPGAPISGRGGPGGGCVPARTGAGAGGPATVRLRHAPEVVAACRVSMALAMFAMLVLL
jgi:hypothetical protein